MQYHINTMPIWDTFKKECDCPLCVLEDKMQKRLVSQYLEENVMEPEERIKVNKYGFCSQHLKKLYEGENKLGLALQLNTRTDSIINNIDIINTPKQAINQYKKLSSTMDTCVICTALEEVMIRYAYTIAQMYVNEKDFPPLFNQSHGFCMPHYALLLKYAHKAGKKSNEFIHSLSVLQKNTLTTLNNEVTRFTNKFDYRSTDKNSTASNDAVEKIIIKLKGRILH